VVIRDPYPPELVKRPPTKHCASAASIDFIATYSKSPAPVTSGPAFFAEEGAEEGHLGLPFRPAFGPIQSSSESQP